MYLFFDTETTGLSNLKDHVVQLAWVLTDDAGNIKVEECHVIRPDGYSIPDAAARIHGITTAKACQIGQPLALVLGKFSDVAARATIIIAHNLSFDLGILKHDYKVASLPFPLHGKTQICTMKLSTAWCRLPKLNGSTGFKWPKLEELHFRLFGKGFDGAHDALADSHACRRCYFELVRLEVITPPPQRVIAPSSAPEGKNENQRKEEKSFSPPSIPIAISSKCTKCRAVFDYAEYCPLCHIKLPRQNHSPTITSSTKAHVKEHLNHAQDENRLQQQEEFHSLIYTANGPINLWSCPMCAQKFVQHDLSSPAVECPHCNYVLKKTEIKSIDDGCASNEEITSEDLFRSFGALDLKIVIERWEKLVASWCDKGEKVQPQSLSDETCELEDWPYYQLLLDNFERKFEVIDVDVLDKTISERIPVWSDGVGCKKLYLLFEWIHFIFRARSSSKFIALEILRRSKKTEEMLIGGIACYIAGLPDNAQKALESYLPICETEFTPNPYFGTNRNLITALAVMTAMLIEDFERDGRHPPQYFVSLVNKFVAPYWVSARKDPENSLGVVTATMIRLIQGRDSDDYKKYASQLDDFLSPLPIEEPIEDELHDTCNSSSVSVAIGDSNRAEIDKIKKRQLTSKEKISSEAFVGNMELCKKIASQRIAVLTIRQWEGGPWLVRAYKAYDVVTTYINTVPSLPLYATEKQMLSAAVGHSEALQNSLYDLGVEPLDTETGSNRLIATNTLTERMKRAAQTSEPKKKKWSCDSKTRLLRNNITGKEYFPKEYEHQRSSTTSGYQILHGPDVWVNDWDVD